MHVTDATMPNTTMLPPRFEDRGAALERTLPAFPVYEEVSGSLRPTWLPVDPTTFRPPAPKSRRITVVRAAQLVMLLAVTWVVSFGSVVGAHVARDFVAKRAAAAGSPAIASNVISPDATAMREPARNETSSAISASAVSAATKTADSGVTFTVDVNDLPISKDQRGGKARGTNRKLAAGS